MNKIAIYVPRFGSIGIKNTQIPLELNIQLNESFLNVGMINDEVILNIYNTIKLNVYN